MAQGMNKVFLLGNVGNDPELKFADSESPLLNFNLATSYRKKDKHGEWHDDVEWHHISISGKRAAALANILQKGERVMIEGRISTRSWVDDKGIKKYWTEVRARELCFAGGRRRDGDERPAVSTSATGGGRKTAPAVQAAAVL